METQIVEYKESWQDEYLKIVAAFANTEGGTLYIGVRDDGSVCGLKDTKKLLEDLPNKTINTLGITVSVALQEIENKNTIAIIVAKSKFPVSFQSKFYIRSGSTTQELKGAELQQFILDSNNITWDEIIIPDIDFDDIDRETVARFVRRGIEFSRLPATTDANNLPLLFDNLNLTTKNGEFTRAAILLFGKRTQRYFSQAHFKIGRFAGSDPTALLVQDDVEGNLFDMPEKVIELLKAKYLPSFISYNGLQRIEKLEIPEKAMREAVLNAIMHRDYASTSAIFMRIYDKSISIWNYGSLPAQLTAEDLTREHSSFPRNRLIAKTFFRAGYVETWGRGILNIVDYLKKENIAAPHFKIENNSFTMFFDRNENAADMDKFIAVPNKVPDEVPDKVPDKVPDNLTENQKSIIDLILQNSKSSMSELSMKVGISKRKILNNTNKLKNMGLLSREGGTKNGYWKIIEAKK
ncbi:MAG: putative DNA binding domain-containing protein [Prevotellaceae bacterium]|jgi:ATP-dependent DNA helicase RecG|nr:putative DNA binding domain-containing protein [Prevotellaceae bacterium]